MSQVKTLAIVGAGPVGLAAAAHALERGLTPIVLERGPEAGHAIRQWAHVRMFSTWSLNIDAAAARLLRETGWTPPNPLDHPTGGDLLAHYVAPLAAVPALRAALRTSARVRSIGRRGLDKVKDAGRSARPFELVVDGPAGAYRVTADAVIDASGTWFQPNPAGSDGRAAPGEAENAERIAYAMPEIAGAARDAYAGKTVAVLGGGHSAIGTLIELDGIAGRIVWLYRGADLEKAFGGGGADKLAARGALGTTIAGLVRRGRIAAETEFRLAAIERAGGRLRLRAEDGRAIEADRLIAATGFRPDLDMLREVRLDLDPALECPRALGPLIDPNLHSCGTVRPHGAKELAQPEAGFYLAGMKAYGRAPTFLLATGYEQVRSIVAALAGDTEAAAKVELVLPETGVCAGPKPKIRLPAATGAASGGCCPARAPALTSASADTR